MNLQEITGGGEVYTHAITRALVQGGAEVSLYVHPGNRLWDNLEGERIRLVRASTEQEFLSRLPSTPSLVVAQGPISQECVTGILRSHRLAAFAHMPIVGERSAVGFRRCHLVVTVSDYCISLLRKAGIEQVYPHPMYGTTEAQAGDGKPVVERSPYSWDGHKLRDVVLGAVEPLVEPFRSRAVFARHPGLTLGVVSLLSTIKQFPLLFGCIATAMARHPQVNLEIFGDGGYAQVRDIRRALAPLGGRARLWGYQRNVHDIYPQLDYLLTGLPEKEALGLNVLEAQVCGTPVLAPDAPPFTETVVPGRSGFLYRDPRLDAGAGFTALLDSIVGGRPRPDPRIEAADHLRQFSHEALVERVKPLLEALGRIVRP